MRVRKLVKIAGVLLIFYLLQRYVRARVAKYLLDAKLSRSSAIMYLNVDVGTQAKLLCPVRSDDLKSLLWTKVDKDGSYSSIANYSTLVTRDRRVSINATQLPAFDMYYSWLMIEKVSEEDGGTYLCHDQAFKRKFIEVNVLIGSE